ncbi:MAG: hypothetical protein AAF799_15490 [Myxococcota bacterium]
MIRGRAVVAGVMALAGCEAEVRHVELVLGSVTMPDEQAPRGFDCIDEQGRLMACRVYDRDPPVLSVVVDVIPLGGVPRCRPTALESWCADPTHDCSPDLDRRSIYELPVGEDRNLLRAVEQAREALSGQRVPDLPLDDPVIIRATVIAGTEADVEAQGEEFACETLMGCVYSCPVVLGGFEGEIPLELDVSNVRCMDEVHRCASNPMFALEPNCSGESAQTNDVDPLCSEPE